MNGGYGQGANADVVATEDQHAVAAEVTSQAHDAASFVPSIVAAKRMCAELVRSDVSCPVVADAGNPEPLTTDIVATPDAPQGNGRKQQAATIEPVCAQIAHRRRPDPHVPASRQPPHATAVERRL